MIVARERDAGSEKISLFIKRRGAHDSMDDLTVTAKSELYYVAFYIKNVRVHEFMTTDNICTYN